MLIFNVVSVALLIANKVPSGYGTFMVLVDAAYVLFDSRRKNNDRNE
ncbi:TPA: hypothetical protein ACWWDF_003115 [Enterococcus faecium]